MSFPKCAIITNFASLTFKPTQNDEGSFLTDNIGQSFVGVVAQALDDNYRRYHH